MKSFHTGDLVQTLTTANGARTVSIPTGSIGRIDEVHGDLYSVVVPLPLMMSNGGLFFYDEEKETIGAMYRGCELRRVEEGEPTRSVLVNFLCNADGTVDIYDVSKWGGLLESSRQNFSACPLLHHIRPHPHFEEETAFLRAIDELWEQCYFLQNAEDVFTPTLLRDVSEHLMLKTLRRESDLEQEKRRLHGDTIFDLEQATLPYSDLTSTFMECYDRTKERNYTVFAHELSRLEARSEVLESVLYQLKGRYRDDALLRLSLYYRGETLLRLLKEGSRNFSRTTNQ